MKLMGVSLPEKVNLTQKIFILLYLPVVTVDMYIYIYILTNL